MAQYYGLFKLNSCIFLCKFKAGGVEGEEVDLQEVSGVGVDAGEELYHFGGLHGGDNSGERSEHTSCRAWCEAALARGIGEEIAVGRGAGWWKRHHLSYELPNSARHTWLAEAMSRVGHKIFGRRVVGTLDHHVISGKKLCSILPREHPVVSLNCDAGIDLMQTSLEHIGFRLSKVALGVGKLTLQIGEPHGVEVDDADTPYARRGEIHGTDAAQRSGTHDKHRAVKQSALPLCPYFVKHDGA